MCIRNSTVTVTVCSPHSSAARSDRVRTDYPDLLCSESFLLQLKEKSQINDFLRIRFSLRGLAAAFLLHTQELKPRANELDHFQEFSYRLNKSNKVHRKCKQAFDKPNKESFDLCNDQCEQSQR